MAPLNDTYKAEPRSVMKVSWALKEWNAAVTALLQGQTVLLLRKGGIREDHGQFHVVARKFLLLPTSEHQGAQLLKPEYQSYADHPQAKADTSTICFNGWASITHVLRLDQPEIVRNLLPCLIWNRQFVQDRLQWKPNKPLYGIVLRAYHLAHPIELVRHSGYGGCRSWVDLGTSVAAEEGIPALTDAAYQDKLNHILGCLPRQLVSDYDFSSL